MTGPLGTMNFVSLNFIAGNIEILGKQNSLFPRDQSLSVSYHRKSIIDLVPGYTIITPET